MSSTASADVLVVGAGVIGLSVAFHLLRSAPALRIVIADADAVISGEQGQASHAAAGMLAPFAEAKGPGPFVRLGTESLCRYPAFVDSIRDTAGDAGDADFAITGAGMLRVAPTPEQADGLNDLYTWQRSAGFDVSRLSGEEARAREPLLSGEVRSALYSPSERQVDPRRMRRSLVAACRHLGADIWESSPVRSIDCGIEGFRAVAGDRSAACGQIVLAAGVWGAQIGREIGIVFPVEPVKGQILALRGGGVEFSHTIYASSIYLVPRPDGRVIVGATEEPGAGFDVRTHAEDVESLRQRAVSLVPSLANASLDGPTWAGLRPGTPDGLPILGELTERPGIYLATGHFRNGILLAPVTGEIIAHEILCGEPHPLLVPEFRPERFSG